MTVIDWEAAASWPRDFFILVLVALGFCALAKWFLIPMRDRWISYMDQEAERREREYQNRIAAAEVETEQRTELIKTLNKLGGHVEGQSNHLKKIYNMLETAAAERAEILARQGEGEH